MKRLAVVLSRARRAAEEQMSDHCLIKRSTGQVTDEEGVVSESFDPNPVYDGPAKMQAYTNRVLTPVSGEHKDTLQHYTLDIPMSVVGVLVTDLVVFTEAAFDPDLVGRTFRVTGLSNKSQASARRLNIEEVTG